jgi:hypothetical protein
MGDRANIKLTGATMGEGIHLYSHWGGSNLPTVLKSALERGRDRWGDPQYLGRIIFSEMIQDSTLDNTGFGLSVDVGDGDDRILTVDMSSQTVTDFDGKRRTFEDFCT